MEYSEEDYLMISGIQHFKFCRRQWALIHIEQQWAENVHTVVGDLMHKRVHDPTLTEKRKDVILARALPVSSREMGVSGECDVVEFHKCEDGIRLYGHRGLYSIYPVEYKKGKPKLTEEDKLQLAAQAANPRTVRVLRQLAAERHERLRQLTAAYYLTTGSRYVPTVQVQTPAEEDFCAALRSVYHETACIGLNYLRAADGTADLCLEHMFQRMGKAAFQQADQLLRLVSLFVR